MTKTLYMVGGVEKTHEISILGMTRKLELTWADGMVGVCPVFRNKKAAQKYAGKKFRVTEMLVEKEKIDSFIKPDKIAYD